MNKLIVFLRCYGCRYGWILVLCLCGGLLGGWKLSQQRHSLRMDEYQMVISLQDAVGALRGRIAQTLPDTNSIDTMARQEAFSILWKGELERAGIAPELAHSIVSSRSHIGQIIIGNIRWRVAVPAGFEIRPVIPQTILEAIKILWQNKLFEISQKIKTELDTSAAALATHLTNKKPLGLVESLDYYYRWQELKQQHAMSIREWAALSEAKLNFAATTCSIFPHNKAVVLPAHFWLVIGGVMGVIVGVLLTGFMWWYQRIPWNEVGLILRLPSRNRFVQGPVTQTKISSWVVDHLLMVGRPRVIGVAANTEDFLSQWNSASPEWPIIMVSGAKVEINTAALELIGAEHGEMLTSAERSEFRVNRIRLRVNQLNLAHQKGCDILIVGDSWGEVEGLAVGLSPEIGLFILAKTQLEQRLADSWIKEFKGGALIPKHVLILDKA